MIVNRLFSKKKTKIDKINKLINEYQIYSKWRDTGNKHNEYLFSEEIKEYSMMFKDIYGYKTKVKKRVVKC